MHMRMKDLKWKRARASMTQHALAVSLDPPVNQSTISRWEAEQILVPFEYQKQIKKILSSPPEAGSERRGVKM